MKAMKQCVVIEIVGRYEGGVIWGVEFRFSFGKGRSFFLFRYYGVEQWFLTWDIYICEGIGRKF